MLKVAQRHKNRPRERLGSVIQGQLVAGRGGVLGGQHCRHQAKDRGFTTAGRADEHQVAWCGQHLGQGDVGAGEVTLHLLPWFVAC